MSTSRRPDAWSQLGIFLCWLICWALFLAGHLVSVLMRWEPLGRLYPVYNWLMMASVAFNDAAGLKVWGDADTGDQTTEGR